MSACHRSVCVAVVLSSLAGCSSATPRREDASRVPATPPAAAAAGSRRAPDVISQPKPFRLADAARAAADATRAAPAATTDMTPAAPARPVGGREIAARQPAQHPSADEIRGMMRDYLRAFNRHDAAALAAHWSPTGENHDLDSGAVTAAGRDAVKNVFAALFSQDDDALIDIELTAIRPVKDDVAVVDGQSTISFGDGQPAGSRFSAVVVKRDGRWMLEHVRETARRVPEGREQRRPLDELAWLVGSWEDTGEGVTASTRCTWAGNHSYLVRTHLVAIDRLPERRPADGDQRIPGLLPAGAQKPREVMEVIGWDPDSRTFRSWFFAGDGRFAEGTWTRHGDAWIVHVSGRGRDEGCSAEVTLESRDEDSVSVHGDPGRLTNILPPTCSFSRTAR